MRILKPAVIWSAVALWFALTLSGCFLANLQPWHEPGSAVFDPALVGTWNLRNCSENDETRDKYCVMTWRKHRGAVGSGKNVMEDDGYEIEFRGENGQESTFHAYLFEAGGERFLESAVNEGPKVDPAFAVHTLTTNVVWRVRKEEGKLSLEPIKLSWAMQLARDGKLPHHVMIDESSPLLDVPAREATALLAEHAKDPALYENALVWTKGAPGGARPKAKTK